jgi:hypothetical protein
MKFMITYIAPMTMALLMSTTDLYAASAASTEPHSTPRVAAVAGQEWANLRLEGLFTGINRDKLDAVVATVLSRADLTSVHGVISMMQELVPAAQICANFHEDLADVLGGRLRQGQEAATYFTNGHDGKIYEIASLFSPSDSAERIKEGVLDIVAATPISEEAKGKITKYLTDLGERFLKCLQEPIDKAEACGFVPSEALKAQIAYSLVSQVALGDQGIEMQKAGDYAWMHSQMPLKPEVLNPIRNALWHIFVSTGFVTTPIGTDISRFTYNPAAALRGCLDANPAVKVIVIACGGLPKIKVPYRTPCEGFFPSGGCEQSHAGQVTIALDWQIRPTVFANALMPGLFSWVEKGRIDKVIIEDYASLASPKFAAALRAALGPRVSIFKEGLGRTLSPLLVPQALLATPTELAPQAALAAPTEVVPPAPAASTGVVPQADLAASTEVAPKAALADPADAHLRELLLNPDYVRANIDGIIDSRDYIVLKRAYHDVYARLCKRMWVDYCSPNHLQVVEAIIVAMTQITNPDKLTTTQEAEILSSPSNYYIGSSSRKHWMPPFDPATGHFK